MIHSKKVFDFWENAQFEVDRYYTLSEYTTFNRNIELLLCSRSEMTKLILDRL